MRRATVLLVALALSACDDRPTASYDAGPVQIKRIDAGQPDYTFAGCPDENGPLCPRSATVLCAVNLIGSGDDGVCEGDDDCELADIENDCVGLCGPVAVGAEDFNELKNRIQDEVNRYCSGGTCREAGCDAGTTLWTAACSNSFCVRVAGDGGLPGPDASAPDASPAPDAAAADAGETADAT